MRSTLIAFVVIFILATSGCNAGNESTGNDIGGEGQEEIAIDEVNRYQLVFTGDIILAESGGLLCEVTDGDLKMDFAIDASSGDHTYGATFPEFDPREEGFHGTFTLTEASGAVSAGTANVTFEYGPAPDEYPGVVRAAGSITGSISGGAGSADITGTYACFLMNSEVGA